MSRRNTYFDVYKDQGQINLYQSLIEECVDAFGSDAYYLPRSSESSFDFILGDDPTKSFPDSRPLVVYIENTNSFDGSSLFSKFGMLNNSKSVNLTLGRKQFIEAFDDIIGSRPREGDLIWLPDYKVLIEIKFVNQDKFMYAFGNTEFYGWSLECEEFRFNNERIDNSIDDLKAMLANNYTTYEVTMSSGDGSFTADEIVYIGANTLVANTTATVASWDVETKTLAVFLIKGEFAANSVVSGALSNAQWIVADVENQDNIATLVDDNLRIREESNNIIVTTELNPKGMPRLS